MARGAEQRPAQPQPEAQQSQRGRTMREARRINNGIIAPVIRGEPLTHRSIAEKTNTFVAYAKGQRSAEEPQQPSEPPSEIDVQIAHNRYMRGTITREQLEENRRPYEAAVGRALDKLSGLEPPPPKKRQ